MKNNPWISLIQSFIFVYIFYMATRGFVRIVFFSKSEQHINIIAAVCMVFLFFSTFFYVVTIYHIVGPFRTEIYYKVLVYGIFVFLILGILIDAILSLSNNKKKN